MKKSPIGVIDSGVGGLTILREIQKLLPNESFIYLADQKNLPYGTKSQKEVYRLSKRLVKFLVAQKVKLIVIACNTITVACIDRLRKDYPEIPIIGTVPVVKTASKLTKNGRIGILSTPQTANSKYQKGLINKFTRNLKVLNLGTNALVRIVEKELGNKSKIDNLLRRELEPFKDFKIDVLALGCSHFPLLKTEIQKILDNKIKILDSSGAIARQTKRILVSENLEAEYNKSVNKFYTTGVMKSFGKIKFEKINL